MSDDFEEFDLPDVPMGGAMLGDGTFDQAAIDAMFGDSGVPQEAKKGLRAVLESRVIAHERLPMLEVVCDRVVRAFSSSMRNLTSDAIEVSLEEVTSTRFGEFVGRVALPAMIGVFHIQEWE
ncbi:MAG: flagellar motor switch protein FliM, partial [Sphingomonas echinoides]